MYFYNKIKTLTLIHIVKLPNTVMAVAMDFHHIPLPPPISSSDMLSKCINKYTAFIQFAKAIISLLFSLVNIDTARIFVYNYWYRTMGDYNMSGNMSGTLEIKKLNRDEAFRYMGYKGGEINQKILDLTDQCEEALLKAIKPRMVYRIFDIMNTENGVEVKNTPLIFKGKDIKAHLENCHKAILMCATLSAETDKLIRTYEAESIEKAFIADALASAAVEQICETAEEIIHNEVGEYSYTWRFSAGYGDFPLDVQRDFLRVTDAAKIIGLNITDSLILIPRKSVTAVIGISEEPIPPKRRGCICCNMRDRCEYRKGGNHCGF